MATGVNDELVLENQVEMIRFLVLNNSDLHGLTLILVIEVLGPQGRSSLLILEIEVNA
jgi:hypothetical protein